MDLRPVSGATPDRCHHDADPDSCDACYADDVHWATLPVRSLSDDDLAELEATNPEVAAAVEQLDREKERQLRKMRRG